MQHLLHESVLQLGALLQRVFHKGLVGVRPCLHVVHASVLVRTALHRKRKVVNLGFGNVIVLGVGIHVAVEVTGLPSHWVHIGSVRRTVARETRIVKLPPIGHGW